MLQSPAITVRYNGCLFVISFLIPMYQMFFATSILHVHLMQWDDDKLVEQAVNKCNEIWESIESNKVSADIPYLAYCFLVYLMRTLVYIMAAS